MREFEVKLRCVKDVQDFVSIATTMGFPVTVGDDHHLVNGCSFMEMFCLDCNHSLTVSADCGQEQFEAFLRAAQRFVVE